MADTSRLTTEQKRALDILERREEAKVIGILLSPHPDDSKPGKPAGDPEPGGPVRLVLDDGSGSPWGTKHFDVHGDGRVRKPHVEGPHRGGGWDKAEKLTG